MKKMGILFAAIVSLSAPVLAQAPQDDPIIVPGPAASLNQDEWTARISENLSESIGNVERRYDRRRIDMGHGVAYVRFQCGEDGRATNISISTRGTSLKLDRAARIVVRDMGSMHPLFTKADEGQIFEAAIVFARNEEELDKFNAQVGDYVGKQNAQYAALGVPNPVMNLAVAGILR